VGPSTRPAPAVLASTGYVVLGIQAGVLIADCGDPGPDDLPAHVHADALSFELSLGGQRVLGNAGGFDYTPGTLRDALRATRAHNTVEIDAEDQSEVWAAFRVGRRARVSLVSADAGHMLAAHDGYARLGVQHERRIDAVDGVGWRVLDQLVGR